METDIQSVTIDGIEYRRSAPIDERKLIRSSGSGVWFATIAERDGDRFVLENARRIWSWQGAASLSELAERGTSKPAGCKFPVAASRVEVFNVLEVLDVTTAAAASIDSVKAWSA